MTSSLYSDVIVKSMLDLDAYKINMMQAIHSLYPDTLVRYELIVRSDEDISDLLPDISSEINKLEFLKFSEDDIQYLRSSSPHLTNAFLHSLRYFRFSPKQQVEIGIIEQDNKRQLRIGIEGAWKDTILYETIIMSIVSEVRNRLRWPEVNLDNIVNVLDKKINQLKATLKERDITNFRLTEMGTRRRFSVAAQEAVIGYLNSQIPELMVGTSNTHFARQFNMTPIGTIAHEWFMGHQALVNPRDSQKVALEQWLKAFGGQLSIAPTDTLTIDAFLQDFNMHLAKAYDGVRHDSGCPFTWGDKLINHYKQLGINPLSKVFVFSDSLNFEQSLKICEYFKGRANISFGIGTFLTNDLGDWENEKGTQYRPLSMVIKLTECNGRPVAKISDEPSKAMCEDAIYLANLKRQFGIELDIDQFINQLSTMKKTKRVYIAAA
ncbi:nicotinate phosphoribosyltransferase [Vibrio sp.]|uniref:Nicotinate phosphoribosyltransferase n=1 Tax=Vibrio viridaestus TaxID=2487322 RepID=A0A3N9U9Y2_9VIBR|nr:nicotinate phosphoribosyltransferase [Vibrio viridaestus]MDC0610580.1 nicotinate phosphoribosyltransferase [Vibrio sp.]RQW65116.1 nicotinate phosphoribosyltransferase [Vibrio viridaestus]